MESTNETDRAGFELATIDLGGQTWILRHGETGREWPARVPGNIHADLIAADAIYDPFWRRNEIDQRWIGQSTWTYRRSVSVPANSLRDRRALLRFRGLDTLATVRFDGHVVLKARNMHRTYEADISRWMREGGSHDLEVEFASPLHEIERRQRRHRLPGWDAALLTEGSGWLRKELASFGWDWGPALVSCGIWRPIELVLIGSGRVVDVRVNQEHSDGDLVRVHLDCQIESSAQPGLSLSASLTLEDETVAATVGDPDERLTLTVTEPRRWWPNGMGEQPLYTLSVRLRDGDMLLDVWERRIGLRDLRLLRGSDRDGESFAFACNGRAFFAKGSNWIPPDAIRPRVGPGDYRRLVSHAAEVGMNMVRVWGGGVFEEDAFYDACDELGVCVWQDFLFAGVSFPGYDPEYVDEVRSEAEDCVRRLGHHACIALFCGNNELEMGLVGDRWSDDTMSWTDYLPVMDELLPGIVHRLAPGTDYWPASPHTPGPGRGLANDPRAGDAHLWAVWLEGRPAEWYRTSRHRFISEFGMQAFPHPRTIESFSLPEDRDLGSAVMRHHQRGCSPQFGGNSVLLAYLAESFRMPRDFASLVWQSQILQAHTVAVGVEHWRRSMPHTMGTLYWQLNDTWPAISWSSIDWCGRWKALHYLARRFYAPVLLSALEEPEKGTVSLHVSNDLDLPASGIVRWHVTRTDGTVLRDGCHPVLVPPQSSCRIVTVSVVDELRVNGPERVLVWADLEGDHPTTSPTLARFARPADLELPRAAVTMVRDGDRVLLTADQPALWAWVPPPDDGTLLVDDFVHLRPGRPVVIADHRAAEVPLGRPLSLVDTWI